ncbi:hypothetical protein [Leptospira borgpetersenii]|nr:hypothetical protein [Leptospira borgpetersenii]MBF3312658.1 hypothetical protein [Leptospira borgpetersenii serovar Hardjo-bovis]MBF3319634.1 hypothetical protein [Leptospira borgpetersenii serovar Hardjo-bovis]
MLSFPSPAFLTPWNQEYYIRDCLMSKNHANLRDSSRLTSMALDGFLGAL